jgi:cell division protein FtsB
MEKIPPSDEKYVSTAGKLELGSAIRRRLKVVRAAELAGQVDSLRVLNMSTLQDVLRAALAEATAWLTPRVAEKVQKRCLEQAEESLRNELAALQARNTRLEAKVRELKEGAARAPVERQPATPAPVRKSASCEEVLAEVEKRFERLLRRAELSGDLAGGLKRDIRGLVSRALEEQRYELGDRATQAEKDKIAFLERKVQRLAGALEAATKERNHARRELDKALKAAQLMPFADFAKVGIDHDDPDRELKLSLLKEIVHSNRELRRAMPTPRALEGRPGAPA